MHMTTKNDIFKRYKEEYWAASGARKKEILDHVVDVTCLHRKAAIRKFRRLQRQDPARMERRGRDRYYTKEVDAALCEVWTAANYPCGDLLHPEISDYVDALQRHGRWQWGSGVTAKLLEMSAHTVRRRIQKFRERKNNRKGVPATKPSPLKSIIPIFKGPWEDQPVGHGQIDTVHHCGETLSGDYIVTLNYTDAATYWMIPRAQWNKGQEATTESMKAVKERLPVRWWGAHPDTGGEFINWVAKQWCDREGIALSRSEPGKKNDNMYVEERNGHVVRKYVGYVRLDDPALVPLVNELYDLLALYLNHFQAVRRTVEKKRVGARYVRRYEENPRTPYQRMLERDDVPGDVKEKLRQEHESLDPLQLKQEIDTLTKKLLKKARGRGS